MTTYFATTGAVYWHTGEVLHVGGIKTIAAVDARGIPARQMLIAWCQAFSMRGLVPLASIGVRRKVPYD